MSVLAKAMNVVKTVNKAKDVLMGIAKSKSDTVDSSVNLKSNPNVPVIAENADYRADKELNLANFKLLLKKFIVQLIIFIYRKSHRIIKVRCDSMSFQLHTPLQSMKMCR